MSKHVVLPGGSGFLGSHLSAKLVERGDRVTILSRSPSSTKGSVRVVEWDGRSLGPWADVLDGADAIVHLSGKRVDCRPTRKNIAELISSRVEPVLAVGEAWRHVDNPPPTWVQLSSLAIFGEGEDAVINESTLLPTEGPRQMVGVCMAWEAAFDAATETVPRRVLLRPAIAIGGKGDPATERLMFLSRMGLGGRVGSGKQWVSWIGLDDFLAVLLRAIDNETMRGLYHVTAPNPVRNAEMMAAYRNAVGRSFGLPSPTPLTYLGAWALGSDPALALTGRRGIPTRLLEEGFEFTETDFDQAVSRAVWAAGVSQ